MKIFYQDNLIKGICWDRDFSTLDQTKLVGLSVLEVDENVNNPLTCDIARWWNRGKYFIKDGELYSDDSWVEPVDLPPVFPNIEPVYPIEEENL